MSVVDNRNVLVAFTADNCGACTIYKQNGLSQLQKELQTLGIVRVVHINKKAMKDTIEPPYPTQLNSLGDWYPRFALINGKAWNNNFAEHKNSDLPVEIFNGIYKDGVVKMDDNRRGFDKIIAWISENVDSNPKFKVNTVTIDTITPKSLKESFKESAKDGKPVYVRTCGSLLLKPSSRR
jgi:hypothetical protein